MQCVILSGGLGTRMQNISKELPKALIPVGDRSFMEWQLGWLKLLGVDEVLLSIGFRGQQIEDCLKKSSHQSSFPKVSCYHDGAEPLGTGGAVAKLLPVLDENFIVTYGDSFVFLSPHELLNSHLHSKKPATMSIFKNDKNFDTSNVTYNEKTNSMHYDKFKITSEMNFIDYGMLVLQKEAFQSKVVKIKFDLAEPLIEFSEKNLLNPFLVKNRFQEVGSAAGYEGFKKLMKEFDFNLSKMKNHFKC